MGNLIGHKTTQKLFKISDNMALTVAGLVGDAQMLARCGYLLRLISMS